MNRLNAAAADYSFPEQTEIIEFVPPHVTEVQLSSLCSPPKDVLCLERRERNDN